MSILPTDLPSFVWGLAIGALGAFFTGLFKKLGEESWLVLKGKIFPKPPEPIEVAKNFEPKIYEPGSCAWVPELKVVDKEAENYTHYPHPTNGAKCYRVVRSGNGNLYKEFLMAKPDAKKVAPNI